MNLARLFLLGAGLGAIAAFAQMAMLPWGRLGADQWVPFFGFWLVASGVGQLIACAVVRMLGASPRITPVGAALLLALVLAAASAINRKPPPSVFLILSDATRADHLSLYGYERSTSPFLEELARESVVFEDAVSQGSHTIVSTPALLASCYPTQHGLVNYQDVLSGDHRLLPEILADERYYCFGVVTNPHLSAANGFDQGYANYELFGKGHREAVFAAKVRPLVERKLDLHRPLWAEGNELEDPPVFGFIFYTDPHAPYISPQSWRRRFVPADFPSDEIRFSFSETPVAEEVQNLLDQYDATIAYWDSEFRALAESLRERSQWHEALIIYTSDHGEEFLEHGDVGHGSALFEESIHVPLLISFPPPVRFPPLARTTRRVTGAVGGIDVVPTVLEYLGVDIPEEMAGTSVLSAALGQARLDPDREVILEEILDHYELHDLEGIRTTRHKFIRFRRGLGDAPDAFEHLYDLVVDPGETENLVAVRTELADRFRASLDAHHLRVGRRSSVERMEPDAEHLERLEALGYVD